MQDLFRRSLDQLSYLALKPDIGDELSYDSKAFPLFSDKQKAF